MPKCVYYVEGESEKALIAALRQPPLRLPPGKVKVLNPVQNLIPRSLLLTLQPETIVILVFDTDVPRAECLRKNLDHLRRYCAKVKIITLAQVLNLEDELVRATDVKAARELTQSATASEFKTDFCAKPPAECRALLERHRLDMEKLWAAQPPEPFSFVEQNGGQVKR